jgi:S-formylglutathione hydrolase FrmB
MARLDISYYSPALGKAQRAVAIVPEGAVAPYKPLLLLHGLSDDESIWTRRTSIERYVEGKPWVVVMPDGGRGFYTDAVEGFAYGTAIGKELPDLMEKWLPLSKDWAVGGLSMGGYGAVRLALTYPERFKSAHSHSGAMDYAHDRVPDTDTPWGKEYARIVGAMPGGGPNDLYHLASTASARPRLRIDCGTEDFLLQSNRGFDKHLKSLSWGHVYEEHSGGHDWTYWDLHIQSALEWHFGKG